MKKVELIKLLEQVPDDVEIVCGPECDDILGYYYYNQNLNIYPVNAFKSANGLIKLDISNDVDEDDSLINVWILS